MTKLVKCEKQMIGYEYRLEEDGTLLNNIPRWAGTCRYVFNAALEHRKVNYNQFRKSLNYFDQANELKELKRTPGLEWISETPSQSIQQALKDLDGAYKKFFSGGGFPSPRKKNVHDTVRFPDPKQFKVLRVNKNFGLIELPKKVKLRFRMSRNIVGTIKNCTIKKKNGHWWISFCCVKEAVTKVNSESEIGIDRGISDSMVCSNGEIFNLPKSAKTGHNRIKVLQKRLRNKKKFSKNWHKDQAKIRKGHSKITSIRKDFLHKTSTHLAKNHGLIVMEDLKIRNMSKSAKGTAENPGKNVSAKSGLNREILLQGWGMFASMVNYKTSWSGGRMELVNPKFTSQRCSVCLYHHKENRKGKTFLCLNCGYQEDADLNASKNIKNTAGQAGSACGDAKNDSVYEAGTSGKRTRKSA